MIKQLIFPTSFIGSTSPLSASSFSLRHLLLLHLPLPFPLQFYLLRRLLLQSLLLCPQCLIFPLLRHHLSQMFAHPPQVQAQWFRQISSYHLPLLLFSSSQSSNASSSTNMTALSTPLTLSTSEYSNSSFKRNSNGADVLSSSNDGNSNVHDLKERLFNQCPLPTILTSTTIH